jgi:hypothetical protein
MKASPETRVYPDTTRCESGILILLAPICQSRNNIKNIRYVRISKIYLAILTYYTNKQYTMSHPATLASGDAPRFFYRKVLVRILILKICDKRAHRGVKNALDLADLQNTLDWY